MDTESAGYSLAFARNMVPARMGPYSSALPPIYQRFAARYLALGGPGRGVERLHGDWGDRSLMIGQFPTYAAVAAFWWSAEYRAAAALRVGAVEVDVCRLAGRVPPAGHAALLVLAFRPDDPSATSAFDGACQAAPGGCLIAPVGPGSFEVLEGNLAGWSIRVLSFADRETLDVAWAPIEAAVASRGDLQAYAAARAPGA